MMIGPMSTKPPVEPGLYLFCGVRDASRRKLSAGSDLQKAPER